MNVQESTMRPLITALALLFVLVPFTSVHAVYDLEGVGGDGPGGDPGVISSVDLSASPQSIETGHQSELSWASQGATACSINQGIGNVSPESGSVMVSPSATTAYTITCDKEAGGTMTDTVTITVTQPPAPLAVSCAVGPETGEVGDTIQWEGSVVGEGTPSSLYWKRGTPFTTKICTGGQNYTSPHRTCPDEASNLGACTVAGQRCRESAGCDGAEYVDGSGKNNAHTTYGSVIPYTCTSTSGSTPSYTYSWTGTDGLSGATQTVAKTYASAGTKSGTVTVTSSAGTGSATCAATITQPPPETMGCYRAEGPGTVCIDGVDGSGDGVCSTEIPACGSGGLGLGTVSGGSYYETTGEECLQGGYVNGGGAHHWRGYSFTSVAASYCAAEANLSCTVSSTSIAPGGSVTYTAHPEAGVGAPYTWNSASGSGFGSAATVTRTLTTEGSYDMNVSASGAQAYCPLVTVGNSCTDTNANLTITATPARVRSGQSSLLSWSVTDGSSSCTVTGPGVSWSSEVSPAPACSASGSASTVIAGQSTYVLTCGSKSTSVTVNVIPNVIEF